jgi:hypothetical protein
MISELSPYMMTLAWFSSCACRPSATGDLRGGNADLPAATGRLAFSSSKLASLPSLATYSWTTFSRSRRAEASADVAPLKAV